MSKVFCKDCRFLEPGTHFCGKFTRQRDSYLEPLGAKDVVSAAIVNKDNNCPNFQARQPQGWWQKLRRWYLEYCTD